MAGGLINDVLSEIQALVPDSIFWKDLDNTVTLVADQEYVDLSETNILEITSIYQRDNDVRLKRINRRQYTQEFPDTTAYSGKVDYAYDEEQLLNGSGENIFRIYLIPTPSATDTLRYDYIKNAKFSADGTSADAEFSPLPSVYDTLIFAMFKPKLFGIVDPENTARYSIAKQQSDEAKANMLTLLSSKQDHTKQMRSNRDQGSLILDRVKTTPAP